MDYFISGVVQAAREMAHWPWWAFVAFVLLCSAIAAAVVWWQRLPVRPLFHRPLGMGRYRWLKHRRL